jgi:hypothetical protein
VALFILQELKTPKLFRTPTLFAPIKLSFIGANRANRANELITDWRE